MKARLRAGWSIAVAALALGAAPSVVDAQTAPATTNTPAPTPTPAPPPADAVGPSELQNFNLKGKVTRPADQTPTPPTQQSSAPAPLSATPAPVARRAAPVSRAPAATPQPVSRPPAAAPANPGFVQPPAVTAPVAAPTASPIPPPASVTTPDFQSGSFNLLSLWPWLTAGLALAGGAAAVLLWRRRQREAFAEGYAAAEFDLRSPAQPEPAPPLPPVAPPPAPSVRKPVKSGVVASRLRPALEIGFQPVRCLVEGEQVTIEFDLELRNSGPAPARAVLAEASLLNASAAQDQELAIFFANPQGAGERLDLIAPMKSVGFRSRVIAPRDRLHEYDFGGRKAFVPVIAFNALYEWSGGKGQTSAAYLVGRDTRTDKLGPLQLDPARREVSGLGARMLPSVLRT